MGTFSSWFIRDAIELQNKICVSQRSSFDAVQLVVIQSKSPLTREKPLKVIVSTGKCGRHLTVSACMVLLKLSQLNVKT